MKRIFRFVCLLLFAITGTAYGHAHILKSDPANKSTVHQSPKNVVLEFNEKVQITVLTMQKGEGKAQALVPLPRAAVKMISVPIPVVDAGSYTINWRATGDDGHVVSGQVMFTLAPDTAAGSGKSK